MEDNVKTDIRLVERMIARGELKLDDYEKHLKSLGDTAAHAENVEASLVDHGGTVKATPAKTEPAKAAPEKTEPPKAEPAKAAPAKTAKKGKGAK